MISNKDLRVEGSNLIINGEKHPLDPAVEALTKRANTVQGKLSALGTKITAIEALEKTASGNPISLTGVAAAYAMSNIMTIEPVQSGSGDPSPTNVRPISGLTSGEVQTTNGTDTNTATITFGQTVYGGSVNFKTGEVTVTHKYTTVGNMSWSYESASTRFGATLSDMKYAESLTALPPLRCSAYKPLDIMTFNTGENNAIRSNDAGSKSVWIRDTRYTDATAFKTAMASTVICYELATPTTLTLTPAELELLKGNNTISGNGANISISYIGR